MSAKPFVVSDPALRFAEGDLVRVLRGAEDGQFDETELFENDWVEEMTPTIGKVMVVMAQDENGVRLRPHGAAAPRLYDLTFQYPPQVLERVPKPARSKASLPAVQPR